MRKLKNASTHQEIGESKPLLMVDIDGVVSLFGPPDAAGARLAGAGGGVAPSAPRDLGAATGLAPRDLRAADGSFRSIDGIPHFLSSTAAAHLLELACAFDLVWASGWEEKANEYLPHLLGLPARMPFVRFAREENASRTTHAHWKLSSIDAYAGARPLAWIDDAFNPACHAWASAREAPTLLVSTSPELGLTAGEAELLLEWAGKLQTG